MLRLPHKVLACFFSTNFFGFCAICWVIAIDTNWLLGKPNIDIEKSLDY